MTSMGERVFYSTVIGFAATAPFYFLQYYYSGGFPLGVPDAVFRTMWTETTLLSFLGFSIYRTQFSNPIRQWIIPFVLKLAAVSVLVLAWFVLVIDQMPCFLGGRGC